MHSLRQTSPTTIQLFQKYNIFILKLAMKAHVLSTGYHDRCRRCLPRTGALVGVLTICRPTSMSRLL